MRYKHTQTGYPIVIIIAIILIISLLIEGENTLLITISFPILYIFSSLKVEVTEDEIIVSFHFIRKRIRLSEVYDVMVVRNPWYYGWGIRKIPDGWMYNISGYDAVELHLKDGKVFRIGSDKANRLSDAIRKRIR